MIVGTVNTYLEPVIPLSIRGRGGMQLEVPAVVDTGFSGYVILSPSQIAALGLEYSGVSDAWLADGSAAELRVYDAAVPWDGADLLVEVLEGGDAPVVGVALLRGFDFRAQFVDGGPVQIQRLG
jgi:clan AA aspartic protease